MSLEEDIWNPEDLNKTKEEMKKEIPIIPCNIWSYIKDLEARILELEK